MRSKNTRTPIKREVKATIHVTASVELLALVQASAKAADRTQAAQVRHLLAWAIKNAPVQS